MYSLSPEGNTPQWSVLFLELFLGFQTLDCRSTLPAVTDNGKAVTRAPTVVSVRPAGTARSRVPGGPLLWAVLLFFWETLLDSLTTQFYHSLQHNACVQLVAFRSIP